MAPAPRAPAFPYSRKYTTWRLLVLREERECCLPVEHVNLLAVHEVMYEFLQPCYVNKIIYSLPKNIVATHVKEGTLINSACPSSVESAFHLADITSACGVPCAISPGDRTVRLTLHRLGSGRLSSSRLTRLHLWPYP